MKNTKQIFSNPTDTDLIIPGMLLSIKTQFNSFSVEYQLEGTENFAHQLVVCKKIFPIRYLVQFFKVNGKADKNYFVVRPKELLND